MITAVYPGSFDPFTLGHADVIERALCCFDRVLVAVIDKKQARYSTHQRCQMIEGSLSDPRLEVASFDGLLVDFLQEKNLNVVVRGLRSSSDFDYEMTMSHMNQSLAPHVQTVLLPASPDKGMISSSLVNEVLAHGGDISQFVPSFVHQTLSG